MKYADASAVLRLLFVEPGIALPIAAGEILVSSTIVEIETHRALDRARITGKLNDAHVAIKRRELESLLGKFDLMALDERIVARAKGAFPVAVRALDAIHVATAEVLAAEAGNEPLEFWTHDNRQASAASARGLTVHGQDE